MIQQTGYGQIYGDMGGAMVGASIYSAARENVTFARMVELQKLNLQKRQLRQQEAQAAANADLSRRRMDLENTRLQLESRRLDMLDKQREEEKLRAAQAYEAKLWEMENRQWEKEQEAARQQEALRLKAEQQAFDNAMDVSKAGGNIAGVDGQFSDNAYNYIKVPGLQNVVRVPVAQGGRTATAQTRGVSAEDAQLYKRVKEVVDGDVKAYDKGLAEKRKLVETKESRLRELEETATLDGDATEVEKLRGEIAGDRRNLESGESRDYAKRYDIALSEDVTLARDVPYSKWRALPWREYSGDQQALLYGLLNDGTAEGRELLKALVGSGEKNFNPWVADAWKSAKKKLGDKLALSPDEWMKKYPYEDKLDSSFYVNPYRDAAKKDGTILMDVDYHKYLQRDNNSDRAGRELLDSLLKSDSIYDRELLSKIVDSDAKDFDVSAATEWRNAAAKENAAARKIDPGVWMAVGWDGVDAAERAALAALLESDGKDAAALIAAKLYKLTDRQAYRGPDANVRTEEAKSSGKLEIKEDRPKAGGGQDERKGGRGVFISGTTVRLVYNGRRVDLPRDKWESMTSEERKDIQRKFEESVR